MESLKSKTADAIVSSKLRILFTDLGEELVKVYAEESILSKETLGLKIDSVLKKAKNISKIREQEFIKTISAL